MTENRYNSQNDSYSEREDEDQITLATLTKKEQDYRHKWQDKFIKTSSTTFRLGQFFGLIYNLAILYVVYDLIQLGEKSLAIKIFALNLALIAFAVLVTSIERKILTRKPARKTRDNKRNFKTNNNRNSRPSGRQ